MKNPNTKSDILLSKKKIYNQKFRVYGVGHVGLDGEGGNGDKIYKINKWP